MSETVELAFKYGPFCFGIFLVITAAKLTKDGLPKGLIWLFSASGILFMAVSVAWWLRQPGLNVFEGTLRDLKAYERLSSDDVTFFYREEPKTLMGDDDEQLRNVRFAVVKRGVFAASDSFAVDYRKDGGPRETFHIPFSEATQPEFVIVWDEAAKKNLLKPASAVTAFAPRRLFEGIAFAQETNAAAQVAPIDRARDGYPPPAALGAQPQPPPPAGARPRPATRAAGPRLNPEAERQVLILQDARSEVGAKIGALDQLLTYDSVGVGVLMKAATERGPVAATLLDLSRHSDPELAAKARALVGRADLTATVAKGLASADPVVQANAQAVVRSMDSAQAEQVVKPLPPAQRQAALPASAGGQPLPTGSRTGDRYYVKASWDPKAKPVVACLTTFFNGFLLSNRSLADEQRLMQARGDRLVYGFSRDQALFAAGQISACGGRPSFVVPWKN